MSTIRWFRKNLRTVLSALLATLVLTGASGSYSGVIAGSGGLTLTGGNQSLAGAERWLKQK